MPTIKQYLKTKHGDRSATGQDAAPEADHYQRIIEWREGRRATLWDKSAATSQDSTSKADMPVSRVAAYIAGQPFVATRVGGTGLDGVSFGFDSADRFGNISGGACGDDGECYCYDRVPLDVAQIVKR